MQGTPELRRNEATGAFWLDFPGFNIGFQPEANYPNIHHTAKPGEMLHYDRAVFVYDKTAQHLELFEEL